MKFRMVGTGLLIAPLKEKDIKGEILIPTAKGDLIRGEVKESGNGVISNNVSIDMLVGPESIVWFDPRDARMFPMNNESWYIVKQEDLLGIEEERK